MAKIFSIYLMLAFLSALRSYASFTHDWTTALSSQFADYGYSVLTSQQAQFVASHYSIVSLEKCTGPGPTEVEVWATAQQLKSINADMTVMFYWAVDQQGLQCYNAYSEYMQHPEFWLRSENGQFVNNSGGVPILDTTVTEARNWWVSIPLGGTGSPKTPLIDGVLADGTGSRCPGGLSSQKCSDYTAGKSTMIKQLQALFTSVNGGSVIGNGIDMYANLPSKDYTLYSLSDMTGIMGEHFAVFESVLPDGTLNATLVAEYLDAVTTAAELNKTVVMGTWPGLYITPFNKDGWPSWPNNSQPNSTDGWREALLSKHTFALTGFLTVAEENVFMQYEGWYNGITQGVVTCPEAPESCAGPAAWYPDLAKPLGPPLAKASRVGNIYTRTYQHATSVLNLDNPDQSHITWN
jgi:hypothetical protein